MKGFRKEVLRTMSVPELVTLQHKLRKYLGDTRHLDIVMKEIKFRDTGKDWKDWDEPVRLPNPKYKQAARTAEEHGLEWISVVEEFGMYEKRLRIVMKGKVWQYRCGFTEDMLEYAIIPSEIIKLEFERAIHELSKSTGLSLKETVRACEVTKIYGRYPP